MKKPLSSQNEDTDLTEDYVDTDSRTSTPQVIYLFTVHLDHIEMKNNFQGPWS